MFRRSMAWWSPLAFALMGGSVLPAHAEGTPLPGCRPPVAYADVFPGKGSASPSSFLRIGGSVFFTANDGEHGIELWKSDGTAAGTVMVKDIKPGVSGSVPARLTALGEVLLFVADDGTHGAELWRSDGTEAGTTMVREIGDARDGGSVTDLVVMDGKVYFAAADRLAGRELWVTDGTSGGTSLVKDIHPGTTGSITAGSMRRVGSTLYFSADDGPHGFELWKSDGTAGGTALVKEIAAGTANSNPAQLTAVGNTLFFTASDGTTDADVWKSDGTEAGTVRVKDIFGTQFHPAPGGLTAVGGKLFFRLDNRLIGPELWVSDGTAEGTLLVKDIRKGTEGSFPESFVGVDGTLYFIANDGEHGLELWKSDGTAEGTELVKDLVAGGTGSSPELLTAGDSRLFFVANAGTGAELWMSDGTEEGTRLAAPELAAHAPQRLTFTGDALYFSADDGTGTRGREMYSVFPAFFGDCTPPSLTCPPSMTVEAMGRSGTPVLYSPTQVADDGALAPTLSYSQAPGTVFPMNDNVVTITATDAAGNTNTCSFTVAVKDTRAPTVTCPADVEAIATGEEGAVIHYALAQATDTASDVTVDYTTPSGATFSPGTNTVQVTATDASGNVATCSFNVTVVGANSGCGCSSGFPADAPWLLLGALAPLMARRRRSSR